ncbi:thioredoxin-related transmembrane protein 2 homolog [Agrilus planipennis]|uniref:Thioredoxin-related transmembrane protein 2 homolog n=1 Tax=Agrilus planipennis TaxID=224129 RepID=A0A1W4XCE7_AGRPL|nr:thioredoxin-related transmembrane protein 2 homolog [Agrilus planipennis]
MYLKNDLKQLLKPYYIVNIILSISYIILKKLPGVCNYIFSTNDCELDGRETELLFFLLIVVMIRTRKSGNVTMINYISSSFIYTKVANLVLWFYADYIYGTIYGILFILSALCLPEPTYSGPDKVIYFRDAKGLEDELNRDKKKVWLVTFYTMWNPNCVSFAPTFAKLSNEYCLENLGFGKVDVGRYPEAAAKYKINDSSLSQQLPTVILFVEGKETIRRPVVDSKGKVVKFILSPENIKAAFDLNNLYENCTKNLKTPKHIKQE